jgi:uncharacterized CHY-type Zn-finger protein
MEEEFFVGKEDDFEKYEVDGTTFYHKKEGEATIKIENGIDDWMVSSDKCEIAIHSSCGMKKSKAVEWMKKMLIEDGFEEGKIKIVEKVKCYGCGKEIEAQHKLIHPNWCSCKVCERTWVCWDCYVKITTKFYMENGLCPICKGKIVDFEKGKEGYPDLICENGHKVNSNFLEFKGGNLENTTLIELFKKELEKKIKTELFVEMMKKR